MSDGGLIERASRQAASPRFKENALEAYEAIRSGFVEHLKNRPDALESLRRRVAPSLTPGGFPRSRTFSRLVSETAVASACGLALACYLAERDLVAWEFPRFRALRALLGSLGPGDGYGDEARITCLLHDLPPEFDLPDPAFARARDLLRIGNAGLPIRHLGDLYEGLTRGVSGKGRGKKVQGRKPPGMHYTPDTVIDYIISGTLGRIVDGDRDDYDLRAPLDAESILKLRVLDPACGAGHFLLAAARYLARACVDSLVRNGSIRDQAAARAGALAEYRRLVADNCIYGIDIDPGAVELAALSLRLLASVPGRSLAAPCGHIVHGNFPKMRTWEPQIPEVGGGFDAVVGNPPYFSFSGRQKPEGADWNEWAPTAIGRGGWRSMHGLFMLKSLEVVKAGAMVSMIVPDQVGHLKGYEPVRSKMVRGGDLLEVRYWGEEVFDGVTSPALTFIIRKTGPAGARMDSETLVVDTDGTPARFTPEPGDAWFTSPERDTLRQMSDAHVTLREFSDPGVHTGNIARKLVLDCPIPGSVPLLEGRQIHTFRCDEPQRWLDLTYKPGRGEYFRISAEEAYRSTDIVLRQTASRPVAARHVHRCHFRNSVLALRVPKGLSVEYLLGVLNSAAAAFLYRASSVETRQRSFPQIKVGLLRSLPIPDQGLKSHRSRVKEVEEIVGELERQWSADLLSRLDSLVWSLYGLAGTPSAAGLTSAPIASLAAGPPML